MVRSMDAVIFDLDGTLVDTLGDIARAANHVLAAEGLPTHELHRYRTAVGDGAAVLIERIVPADRRELVPAVLARFRDYYPRHMCDSSRAFEGVEPLFATLVGRALPMAVLSNKPEDMTRAMVAALLPAVPFVAVWGQTADRPKKPEPAAALALGRQLGVVPERCALVGDTPVDMQTARRAGMVAIGVRWGFRSPEELRREGAQLILAQPSDLLEVLSA